MMNLGEEKKRLEGQLQSALHDAGRYIAGGSGHAEVVLSLAKIPICC